MATARAGHTATLLSSGIVLIAGGVIFSGVSGGYRILDLASAELYDPAAGTFTATGSMTTARENHTATLLSSGIVLIAGGGTSTASAELYNSAVGTFTAIGRMATARESHTATLLSSGIVLIAGGANSTEAALASAEVYK
jgi:hypothetical protein